MIPLFSTQQIRNIDETAINRLGIPGIVLMENASLSIYNFLIEKFRTIKKVKKIGILCGKGNNGGDGFAVARQLANDGYEVKVIHLGDVNELSVDCRTNYNILVRLSKVKTNISLKKYSKSSDLNELKNCNVIVDALLGSGARGELKDPYKSIIKKVNQLKAFKAAVDIPTGLDADSGYSELAFKADITVTLGEFKKGLFFGDGNLYCGEIVKGWIGVGSEFFDESGVTEFLIEPEDAYSGLPEKKKNIHKYSAGKVLTIAGSRELPGAAAMASRSALKVGAGASILCFPDSARNLIQKKLDEVIVQPYSGSDYLTVDNLREIKKRINWADVVAIGPGLGRNEQTQEAVRKILKDRKCNKIVIDADAVYAIGGGKYKDYNLKNFVLTPHHGEFAHLVGIELNELKKNLLNIGRSFSVNTGSYLVLKGAPTIIFTPSGDALINTTGNPGMAKFGTGDVLTGAIAGLLSQKNNIEEAVTTAVYIHSLASDLLLRDFTVYGYTAKNIINNLPKAIKFLEKSID